MRSVSPRVRRGGALLVLLLVLAVPTAVADDGGNPYEPPEARARPPIGATSADEDGFFAALLDWMRALYARARPPVG